MMPGRALLHFFASLMETIARRILGRPRRRAWPFMFEVVVGSLRRNFFYGERVSLIEARAFNNALAAAQPLAHPVTRERKKIEGVQVEHVRPSEGGARGTLVYLHGGSYMLGSTATHLELIARLALAGPFDVVSVEYRLAPEHRVANAVEDVLTVYRALLETHPAGEITWAGDSAGGGLVYLALVAARDAGVELPAGVATIAPWVDLRCEGASFEENEPFDWGSGAVLRGHAKKVAAGRPLDDPALSPALADLRGLCPSLVHVGDAEIVRDVVLSFVDVLRDQGNDVELTRWPDMVHDFHLLAQFHPDAAQACVEMAAYLRARIERSAPVAAGLASGIGDKQA